jgi:hypothetical protein
MTIKEIFKNEKISVRSFNVCNENDLINLKSILEYYNENRSFDKLRNCGKKSNDELTALCLKYSDYENVNFSIPLKPDKKLLSSIINFSRTQRELINSFIEINTNNLSNRSKKAFTSYLGGNLKIQNISERILTDDSFDFQNIKNVGSKSINELKSFYESLIDFIAKVSEIRNENELVVMRNRFFIEKTFSIYLIPNEILESQSIFSIVDFLIKKDTIFDKNDKIIFQKALKIYENQTVNTIDEIADELKISRERVRQIRKNILENLFTKFQFLRNLKYDLYQKFSLDQNQQMIDVNEDLNKVINQINHTNFSAEFNLILIYSYIPEKFELLGNIEDVLQAKTFISRGRHNWDNFYLVSKELTSLFDFNNFIEDLSNRLTDRIEETYSFQFESYLSKFLKVEDSYITVRVLPVAEKIINKEFDLIIDLNDNIVFKRNTVKQVHEFALEALEKLGVPSKIETIYKLIKKDFPEITKSKDALRGSLQRSPEIIYFGRSSTYGLKKWESEKEGIKGGTIRNIVFKFLDLESLPIHISKISNHVLKYRPNSNEKSIFYNLKLDDSNSFSFFKESYIGLVKKKYDKRFELLSKKDITGIKTWEERYTELKEFLALNNRLPFSSGCFENEIKLYRWYKIQVRKTINGEIDYEKGNLLKEIINQFEKEKLSRRTNLNKTGKNNNDRNYSNYSLDDIIAFINSKSRMPDSRDFNERKLYQFYYRNKKNLENIDTLTDQESKLLELIVKYGSSKHTKYTIDNLLEFIKINKRMPDSRDPHERGLYQFAYRQRKLFKQGVLDHAEENQFIEIAKIIQNHKYENKRN